MICWIVLFISFAPAFGADNALIPQTTEDYKVATGQSEKQMERISALIAEIKKNPIHPNRDAIASIQ